MKKVMLTICLVGLFCGTVIAKPTKSDIKIKIISTETYGTKMIGIKVKITNSGMEHINQCLATCILYNSMNKEITVQKHYVIKSFEGGLDSKASTYFEYIIDVNNVTDVKKVGFLIDVVN